MRGAFLQRNLAVFVQNLRGIQLKAPSSETVRESSLQSHLAISISRGERFDFVLQKATELGVTEITPLFTERTEVKLQGDRLDKKLSSWQKILISACEQCGRNVIPTLNLPQAFEPFIRSAQAEQKFVLHHRNTVSPSNATTAKSVLLLVGPEGGLSEQEIAGAREYDFQNLALGPRVLRTETAPLAALSIFQFLWGDI